MSSEFESSSPVFYSQLIFIIFYSGLRPEFWDDAKPNLLVL